jgi:hypothetical protein
MTAKAALCLAFLEGRVINIKNCFETIGLTNAPREVSRMVEKPFGVTISRHRMTGKSRYGQEVTWFNYRLNKDAAYNQEGIQKMRDYVKSQLTPAKQGRTPKEVKLFTQQELFINSL